MAQFLKSGCFIYKSQNIKLPIFIFVAHKSNSLLMCRIEIRQGNSLLREIPCPAKVENCQCTLSSMWQKEFGTNVWLIKRRECILYLSEKDWLLICKRLANAVMDHWTLYTRMLVDQIKSAHEVELVTCSLLQMIKLGRPTEI